MDRLLDPDDSVINTATELWFTTVDGNSMEVRNDDGCTWVAAVFLIINAALGAGLLNFPQAFDQAGGVVTAVTVQAVLLVFIISALIILAHSSIQSGGKTLQDVLETCCGRFGLIACSLCVALYCFGTCITFLIIIGDQFDRVLASLYGSDFCHYWYMNRIFTVAISSIIVILPLCYSKKIDFLKYASSLGVAAVIYVVILIQYKYYKGNFTPGPIKTKPDSWTDVFFVVPVICFGYQCHVSVIPIYSCLKERTTKNCTLSVCCAIVVCVFTYTVAATYGYLTFGSNVESDILESYNGSDPVVLIGIVAIAVKTFTTYPILLFCGREAVKNLWNEICCCGSEQGSETSTKARVVIATAWFALTLLLAVFIPNIGDVIDVLGSLAAVFIFVFPGICLMQSTLQKDPSILLNKDKVVIILAAIFIILGIFLFGVVFVQAVQPNTSAVAPIKLCI